MTVRVIAGSLIMLIGGLIAAAACVIVLLLLGVYVEWANAADALTTVAMLAAPPVAAGGVIALAGRLVYGAWSSRAPLRKGVAIAVQIGGALIATAFAILLASIIVFGAPVEFRTLAAQSALMVLFGAGCVLAGRWLRRLPDPAGKSDVKA
ncbi:hypothetical protein GC169_09940 [bacterium]|nr:hypothetical protein [bacterium]